MRAKFPGQRDLNYLPLFPAWTGPQPVTFFMLENLLEARADSPFPTNHLEPDEDVNVYLAHLLAEHLLTPTAEEVESGGAPLRVVPEKAQPSRWRSFEHYRRNGDHRLLCLGLYGRGDLLRRRLVPLGWTREEVRARDLSDGQTCYRFATYLLRNGRGGSSGLAPVLTKLAAYFNRYVQVLRTMATNRFDLGSRLSEAALRELTSPAQPSAETADHPVDPGGMDLLLDLISEYRSDPNPAARQRLLAAAERLGIPPCKVLRQH